MDPSLALARALAVLCTVASLVGFLVWLRPVGRGTRRLGEGLALACLLLGLAAWVVRWAHAGHLPLFGTFESSLSLATAVLLAGFVVRLRLSNGLGIWPVACLVTAGLVLHGLGFDPKAFALTISERSWVVDVHALLAWAAFGALLANAGLALRRLILRRGDRSSEDRLLAASLSLGFALHTGMLVSGSIYKFLLFGRAWSFDPVVTLGLVAWLAYGTLLHMRLMAGWSGRRLAGWCLGLFLLLTVSYRGIVYFPPPSTYHIFDVDLRIHVSGSEPFSEESPR